MSTIIHIDETESTNSYLKELLLDEKLEDGTIVVTSHQTAGRGQRGNGWESAKGKNLTFSIALHPSFIPITEQFILSQIASLAIKDTLDKYTNDITIKWPNDIYWNKKKICGILIENTLSENKISDCIIGIGLNINQERFISDAPNPVSLKNITRKEYDLNEVLMDIRENILSYYQNLIEGDSQTVIEKYKTNLFQKEGFHFYNDGKIEFEAQIKDIESTGHLILETREGETRKFAFKEVKYIL